MAVQREQSRGQNSAYRSGCLNLLCFLLLLASTELPSGDACVTEREDSRIFNHLPTGLLRCLDHFENDGQVALLIASQGIVKN